MKFHGIVIQEKSQQLSHAFLTRIKLKSYRNGNWRKLDDVERALFRAGLDLARLRGKIASPSLVTMIKNIMSKLLQTAATKAIQIGKEKARDLLDLYARNGVLSWLPSFKDLVNGNDYLLWLGTSQLTLASIGGS